MLSAGEKLRRYGRTIVLIYLCAIEGQDEKQKFEIIYEEYKNLMFYVANRILEDTQDSEDIVHQAFLKIIEIIDQIEEVKCPQTRSLVVTIVKRKAIDLYRARRRHGSLSLDDDNLCCGIAAETEYVDERMMIAQAIAALPVRYRDLLMLKYDNGYSNREIAQLLDMTEENVKKTIQRAKAKLRSVLQEMGENDEDHR